MSVCLEASSVELFARLQQLASDWQILAQDDAQFALALSEARLELKWLCDPQMGAIFADFAAGAAAHRRKFGGGKQQEIAKAVGLNKGAAPLVLDATAGLGRDAFVLASLGCKVEMVERNNVVAALLADGLQRAKLDSEIGAWVSERMQLHFCANGSAHALTHWQGPRPDVVYLDPMFPHRKKSALVKKEMRAFQSLVGSDEDADALFAPAYLLATKRVVVKRPSFANFLADQKPTMQIATKKNRFDVYVKAAMTDEK